jgi:hypothetical protein
VAGQPVCAPEHPRHTGFFTFYEFLQVQGRYEELWMTWVTLPGNSDGVRVCLSCGLAVWDKAWVYEEVAASFCSCRGSAVMSLNVPDTGRMHEGMVLA